MSGELNYVFKAVGSDRGCTKTSLSVSIMVSIEICPCAILGIGPTVYVRLFLCVFDAEA